MTRIIPLFVVPFTAIALAAGCDDYSKPITTPNTAQNQRDRSGDTLTPTDQGSSSTETQITADIRKAIMADSAMSVDAQNCKVITVNGVVTLRGPVANQTEKDSIEAKARAVAGVTSVVNELELKNPG